MLDYQQFLKYFEKVNIFDAFIHDFKILELYPPFLFAGVKILECSPNFQKLKVRLPFRWYLRNHNNTMFGGMMAAVADPLPAILCGKIFEGTEVWSKRVSIQFLRPGRTDLEIHMEISDREVDVIRKDLESLGHSRPKFTFYYFDKNGHKVAKVENTVALKKGGIHGHSPKK